MPDRPEEMKRNGRPPVPDFDPMEWFYHRVEPGFAKDGIIDPITLKCTVPAVSSNRQRFSQSWYVLYPRAKFGAWAVFKFQRESLPSTLRADSGEGTTYNVRTQHDPQDDNYGHCETLLLRGDERVVEAQVNRQVKNKFRLAFASVLIFERAAGLPFPPPN